MPNKITKYFYQVPCKKVCINACSEKILSKAVEDRRLNGDQDRDRVGVGASVAKDWAGVQENGVVVGSTLGGLSRQEGEKL